MTNFTKKYGPWALITGASSGIGEEFAKETAARGLNVVLAARREAHLKRIAADIEKTHKVQTRVLPVDLTADDYLQTIEAGSADLDIGLLINNAGSATPGAFLKQSLDHRRRNLHLNVVAPMELSHHFGTKMNQKKRGGIIFTGSIVGYTGSPYMANYAGTKAYLLQFGEALSVELGKAGVDVLVVSPGATRTEMVEMEGVNMTNLPMPWMKADRVAQVGLNALGKKSAVIPGFANNMMMFMMTRLMPRTPALKMFGKMMGDATAPALR